MVATGSSDALNACVFKLLTVLHPGGPTVDNSEKLFSFPNLDASRESQPQFPYHRCDLTRFFPSAASQLMSDVPS